MDPIRTIVVLLFLFGIVACSSFPKETNDKKLISPELLASMGNIPDSHTNVMTIQRVHDEEDTKKHAKKNLEDRGLSESDLVKSWLSPTNENACAEAFRKWEDQEKAQPRDEDKSVRLANQFVDICLKPAGDIGSIAQSVTFLYARDSTWRYAHQCLATRISPSRFLTARHCVFREHTAVDGIQEWYPLAKEQLALFLAIQPDIAISISQITHPEAMKDRVDAYDPNTDDAVDFVLLETRDALPAPSPVMIKPRLGTLGERARLVGFYPMLLTEKAKQLLPANWLMAVRMDERPLCHINAIAPDTKCIYHGCQTQSGSSGAPLFDLDRKAIISLHTRQFGAQKGGRCYDKSASDMPNSGLLVPDEVTK